VSNSEKHSEIEITPEMIEAGYQVFLASGVTSDPLEADRLVVAEIFEAMLLCRPTKPLKS
jgi:hypothetical protein